MNSSWRSIISNQAAAAQILGCGAGGKNSRKVGKWESGKVGKLRFLKFRDFSWISLLRKMLKSGISKAPPLIFPPIHGGQRDSRTAAGETARRQERL